MAGCSAIWVGREPARGCWTAASNSNRAGGFKKTHESFQSTVFDISDWGNFNDALTCTRMKETGHLSDGCRRIEARSVASRLAATLQRAQFDAPAPPPGRDTYLRAPAGEGACSPPRPYCRSSSTERPHLGGGEFLRPASAATGGRPGRRHSVQDPPPSPPPRPIVCLG